MISAEFLSQFEMYRRELVELERACEDFCSTYPEATSSMKSAIGSRSDPQTRSILESTAFLAMRIQRQIEDIPRSLALYLAHDLAPELFCPLPSMAMVHFSRKSDRLKAAPSRPVNSLGMVSHDGERKLSFLAESKFIELWPFDCTAIASGDENWGNLPGSLQAMDFVLEIGCSGAASNEKFPRSLRFQICANLDVALAAVDGLAFGCTSLEVFDASGNHEYSLPKSSLSINGFSLDDRVIPITRSDRLISVKLLEYMIFPERFCGFSVSGLDKVELRKGLVVGFKLDKQHQRSVRLASSFIKLNCAPVINLTPVTSNLGKLVGPEGTYSITRSDHERSQWDVFSVESVKVYGKSGKIEVGEYSHSHWGSLSSNLYWQSRRNERLSQYDSRSSVSLRLIGARDSMALGADDELSIRYFATQCEDAELLGTGTPLQIVNWDCGYSARLITTPTKYHPPVASTAASLEQCSAALLGWRGSGFGDFKARLQCFLDAHARVGTPHALGVRRTLLEARRSAVAMSWPNEASNLPLTLGIQYQLMLRSNGEAVFSEYIFEKLIELLLGQMHELHMPFSVRSEKRHVG